jgi:hypothetical protein
MLLAMSSLFHLITGAFSREAKRMMSSQKTIPDDTLYQVCVDIARLMAIINHLRGIKTVQ